MKPFSYYAKTQRVSQAHGLTKLHWFKEKKMKIKKRCIYRTFSPFLYLTGPPSNRWRRNVTTPSSTRPFKSAAQIYKSSTEAQYERDFEKPLGTLSCQGWTYVIFSDIFGKRPVALEGDSHECLRRQKRCRPGLTAGFNV